MKKRCVFAIGITWIALMMLSQVEGQVFVGQLDAGATPTVPDNQATGQPIPRLRDGTVDLTGPWVGAGANNLEQDAGLKPGELDAVLLPWARALKAKRNPREDPYTACLPIGVPRTNRYPWKFAMSYTSKGLTHIYVLRETGDAGAHRVVFMDGRQHPLDPIPTWFGHSIGRFEKDTLVIDTVGYNDKFWTDAVGTPHTEQMHTVERWARINYGRITNDFTLDDPGAFSKPLQLKFTGRLVRPDLKTGSDLLEFICLEGNEYGTAAGFVPGIVTPSK